MRFLEVQFFFFKKQWICKQCGFQFKSTVPECPECLFKKVICGQCNFEFEPPIQECPKCSTKRVIRRYKYKKYWKCKNVICRKKYKSYIPVCPRCGRINSKRTW